MSVYEDIGERVITLLSDDHIRLTPCDLVRAVREKCPGTTRRAVRETIKKLVAHGRLIYTHHFSTSHLELNFSRPVQVSERIFLSPADSRVDRKPSAILVKLLDGSVFGGGDHPTTRMVLCGLDEVLSKKISSTSLQKMRVLDVGTGSGILALAALKLGVATALGVDIDPLACDAARKNAALNGLSHQFQIDDCLPDRIAHGTFDIILANLRPPTLKQLIPKFMALSSPGAVWVLSGFRVAERDGIQNLLPHVGERSVWRADACDWSAWALKFPDSPHRTMVKG